MEKNNYLTGFGNHFETEALPDALPKGQNSPQKVPYGLYAEQLSGSAFTEPRKSNARTWLYKIHPSVMHGKFTPWQQNNFLTPPFNSLTLPTQIRWLPLNYPKQKRNFIESLITYIGQGSPLTRTGAAIHLYAANESMNEYYFTNNDADMLIIPQEGELQLRTEMGIIDLKPGEIGVIPRGVKFQVKIETQARGYVCENFGLHFILPDLGVIGSNGLANPRDFQTPTAYYEDKMGDFKLVSKFAGQLWQAPINYSPLDVVAWHGNYVPYKYDLGLFNTINSVSYDHIDPSVFTVLTAPSAIPGIANLDFVIFPERWVVMEHTLRIPYFHRNIMSEYMGLIYGEYDAKSSNGFKPGGGSLHNCMAAHGPDATSYEKSANEELKPNYYKNTLAFMLESSLPWQVSPLALDPKTQDVDYLDSWQTIPNTFRSER